MPALATATSRPPKRSTVSATAAIIAPWSVTSAPIPIARSPIRSAASRASSASRSRTATEAPAHVHLPRGLEADPARGAGDQRHLSVQVVERACGRSVPTRRQPSGPAPRITRSCPASAPSTPSSPSPSSRSGCCERWRERDVFERSLANREGAEVWSFYEGPPTANGRPGSHHVLARVFKDVYPRYRTMCGYRVPRKAGWDCHGLPVELEVEKQLGISSKQEIEEFGIAEFNQRCRESVFEYVEEWNRLTERIGFWIDLDDPYVTLEDDYIESVWWSLRKLWDDEPPLRGPQGRPLLPALRHRALLARGRAGLQGRRGPLHIRALPAARRGRRRDGRVAAGLDDDALDAARQRRRRRRARASPTSGRGSTARS